MRPSEKALIQNLQTEDLYQHQQMRRDKLALEAGLNPKDYKLPFPSNSSSSTTTIENKGNPFLTTALALMAGGGAMAAIPSVLGFFDKEEPKTIIKKVLEEVDVTTKLLPPE